MDFSPSVFSQLPLQMDVFEHRLRYGHREDDTPPLSLDGSLLSHEDSSLLREATEFEVSAFFDICFHFQIYSIVAYTCKKR